MTRNHNTTTDARRRELLKRLVGGAVYAAPALLSFRMGGLIGDANAQPTIASNSAVQCHPPTKQNPNYFDNGGYGAGPSSNPWCVSDPNYAPSNPNLSLLQAAELQRWQLVPGLLRQISVGSAQHVWGTNHLDDIFRWNGQGWMQVSGKLKQVAVGADGTVWGVTGTEVIYRWANGWQEVPGRLKQISVGSASHVWGVNRDNLVFRWNGSGWQQYGGTIGQVSVGADGAVYGIDPYQRAFYSLTPTGWRAHLTAPAVPLAVAVGSATAVAAIRPDGFLGQWTGATLAGVLYQGGKLSSVGLGADNTLWITNRFNQIYRRV